MPDDNLHLDIYLDRSELHEHGKISVFYEGLQSRGARERYEIISRAFSDGFLDNLLDRFDLPSESAVLTDDQAAIIRSLADGVNGNVGRGLCGVACLQLAIKSICPEQSIRLHKGGRSGKDFSWVEGVSMRSLDKTYNTPFLRRRNLLKINNDGAMMTRTFAENYPYGILYKAVIQGPLRQWKTMVDKVEDGTMPTRAALCLLLSLLKNRSEEFVQLSDSAVNLARSFQKTFPEIMNFFINFADSTKFASRAFEVILHGFMQAFMESGLGQGELAPLSQMRQANKKHGNLGDIEIKFGDAIIESWDAKYGKPYLRDELEELADKLQTHDDAEIVGFISSCPINKTSDTIERAEEISQIFGCEIALLSFPEWVALKSKSIPDNMMDIFGRKWLLAVVESFGQKRRDQAPIDEPCEQWLKDIISMLEKGI